jgi:hypothetical protein
MENMRPVRRLSISRCIARSFKSGREIAKRGSWDLDLDFTSFQDKPFENRRMSSFCPDYAGTIHPQGRAKTPSSSGRALPL